MVSGVPKGAGRGGDDYHQARPSWSMVLLGSARMGCSVSSVVADYCRKEPRAPSVGKVAENTGKVFDQVILSNSVVRVWELQVLFAGVDVPLVDRSIVVNVGRSGSRELGGWRCKLGSRRDDGVVRQVRACPRVEQIDSSCPARAGRPTIRWTSVGVAVGGRS